MNDSNKDSVNSVGEMLRMAREAKKLSVGEAHRETRISVDVLEALEQDDLEFFASDIYLKGFLKNYAAFLGVNVDRVMRTLEHQRGGVSGGAADAEGTAAGRGATWDIEETIIEEKLKSPNIFRRVVVPILFLVILSLAILLILERRKPKATVGVAVPPEQALTLRNP